MKSLHPNERWLIRTTWTEEENKIFESGIAFFDEETPNRWLNLASMIPGKTVCDVINHYRELVADVNDIEAGLVPIPGYLELRRFDVCRKRGLMASQSHQHRKKGVPWTQEEHRRFLLGLEKHGKGEWKNISHKFVVSKTPSQVASHAQKYYLRHLSTTKDKRRPSIHDITMHLIDDKSTEPHKSVNAPKASLDNNQNEALMVFNDSLILNPCNSIATRGFYFDNWLI